MTAIFVCRSIFSLPIMKAGSSPIVKSHTAAAALYM